MTWVPNLDVSFFSLNCFIPVAIHCLWISSSELEKDSNVPILSVVDYQNTYNVKTKQGIFHCLLGSCRSLARDGSLLAFITFVTYVAILLLIISSPVCLKIRGSRQKAACTAMSLLEEQRAVCTLSPKKQVCKP